MKDETLIPIAYDNDGNIVTVKDAVRCQQYVCPDCGGRLMFRNSGKTGPGHRRPHFAHIDTGEHHCTGESVLHATFKHKSAELFRSLIAEGKPFPLEWTCSSCGAKHKGNLLYKVRSVEEEYRLGDCIPDVALLDAEGNTVVAFEVVVTHAPDEQVLTYYKTHGIVLFRVDLDLEKTEEQLVDIEGTIKKFGTISFCRNRQCKEYNPAASPVSIQFVPRICRQCNKQYKRAEVLLDSPFGVFYIPDLNSEEVATASSLIRNDRCYDTTGQLFGRKVHTIRTACGCEIQKSKPRSRYPEYYYDPKKGRFMRRRRL